MHSYSSTIFQALCALIFIVDPIFAHWFWPCIFAFVSRKRSETIEAEKIVRQVNKNFSSNVLAASQPKHDCHRLLLAQSQKTAQAAKLPSVLPLYTIGTTDQAPHLFELLRNKLLP